MAGRGRWSRIVGFLSSLVRGEVPADDAPIGFARALVALAALELATPLLNIVVFPLFDTTFTYARDISVMASAFTLMVLGAVATFRPRVLRMHFLSRLMPLLLGVGSVLLVPSLALRSMPLLLASSVVLSVGRGWVTVVVGLALTRLAERDVPLAVVGAFAAAYACVAVAWVLPTFISLALFFLGPVAALVLAWPYARTTLYTTERAEAPNDYVVTQPATFLPLASQLFVSMFAFKVVFGYALRFDVADMNPAMDWLVALAAMAVVLIRSLTSRAPSEGADEGRAPHPRDTLVAIAVMVVTAGLLYSMVPVAAAPAGSTALLTMGSTLFELVSWSVLVALAARNVRGAFASFSWGQGVASVGSVVGAAFGATAGANFGVDSVAVIMVSALLVFLIMAYVLVCLRGFSFDETIAGVVPVEEEPAAEPKGVSFDDVCDALAASFRLTPREREVFRMLAAGRNREYIEEHLVISRNTVKAHVKHIYTKLGVHSHQELLDIVERGSGGARG